MQPYFKLKLPIHFLVNNHLVLTIQACDKLQRRTQLAEYFVRSETNRNNENAMCDYLSEYLRMCFRLYEDISRPFLNILRTFCERSKLAED